MRAAAASLLLCAACGRIGFELEPTLTVELAGDGVTVTSEPPGIACPGACTAAFVRGTPVTLTAHEDAEAWFQGWHVDCGGRAPCTLVIADDRVVGATASALPNRIFITSDDVTGAINGIAGADEVCRATAAAAGLAGTFIAYLSSASANVAARLGDSRGWIRTGDGEAVAQSLTAREAAHAVWFDEHGADARGRSAFTASFFGSYTNIGDCTDWTVADATITGTTAVTHGDGLLVTQTQTPCSASRGLLCIEIGRTVDVPPAPLPPPTRAAFLSTAAWFPDGGLAGADALCASEAAAAQLAGEFRAALATTTASIASRFDLAGPPWVRVDGVALAATAAAVFEADYLEAAIDRGATARHAAVFFHWTGAASPLSPGSVATTCSDWSTRAMTSSAQVGYSTETTTRLVWSTGGNSCDGIDLHVVCLER